MPLPVIANCYRVALTWNNPQISRNAINVMHILAPASSASAVATAIDAHVTNTMWDQTDQNTACLEMDVTPLDGSSLTFQFFPSGTKWKGGLGPGTDCTPQVAAIAKILTNHRGRRYRGRLFLPFVSEVVNTGGVLGSAQVAAMSTAWGNFLSALGGLGMDMAVASYIGSFATAVTAIQIESLLATQRRRQPRP